MKLEYSDNGKPYYVIEIPKDGLVCLDIVSEFTLKESCFNSDFAAAFNGLRRFFKEKVDEQNRNMGRPMSRAANKRQLLVVVACVLDPGASDVPEGMEKQRKTGPKVLLVRRKEVEQKDIHLMWELPGGKVDFGETAEQALVREVWEETGYQAEIVGLLPFSYTTEWEYEDFRQHTVIYCYECRVPESPKEQVSKDHKVKEVRWFAFDEIDFSRVLPGSREFIWHVAKEYSIELTSYAP